MNEEMENDTLNWIYKLLDLGYSQSLSMSSRILTQRPSFTIQITKVINRTYPLESEGETEFSARWLPTFTGSLDQMFVDENEYQYATSTNTILSITISETPYYVLNIQRPITDLLFTIVCLEIFGLGFLIAKLIILPLIKQIIHLIHQLFKKNKLSKDKVDPPQLSKTRI
jgi:hypothetical protein